jgi:AbrB family looped-hinge helix DNA binding protein
MATIATTKMSSKGQVVIPEDIRKRLGLKAGSQLVVMAGKDAVILKAIAVLSLDKFDELMVEARRQARRAGLKQADIRRVIAQARGHG